MSFEKFDFFKPKSKTEKPDLDESGADEAIIASIMGNTDVPENPEPARSALPKEIDPGKPVHAPINEPRPPLRPGEFNPSVSPDTSYPKPPPKTL